MKNKCIAFVLAALGLLWTSCDGIGESLMSLTLDHTTLEMQVGQSFDLQATFSHSSYLLTGMSTLSWKSSDPTVLSVYDGRIRALKAGVATVTVTGGIGLSATCLVTVKGGTQEEPGDEKPVLTGFRPETEILTLDLDQEDLIHLVYEPEGALPTKLRFVSWDDDVISVTEQGRVKALRGGGTNVEVYVDDLPMQLVQVNVTPLSEVEDVTLNITGAYTLHVGEGIQLSPTYLPEGSSPALVSYASEDTTLATVDQDGYCMALAPGQVTIVVDVDRTYRRSCTLNILPAVGGNFNFSCRGVLELEVGQTKSLELAYTPANAVPTEVNITNNYSQYFTVSQEGMVTALKATPPGAWIDINVKRNPGFNRTVHVTIKVVAPGQPQRIYFDPGEMTLTTPEPIVLNSYLKCEPEGYPLQTLFEEDLLEWTSSNPSVASLRVIEGNANFTPMECGETTITAHCPSLNLSATLKVTVAYVLQGIELHSPDPIKVGDQITLNPIIYPASYAPAAPGVWTNSQPGVARIDLVGDEYVLTALAAGVTTLTYRLDGKEASATVTVSDEPEGMGIEKVKVPKGTVRLRGTHNVELTQDYWMSKYEITGIQYSLFLKEMKQSGKLTIFTDHDGQHFAKMNIEGFGEQVLICEEMSNVSFSFVPVPESSLNNPVCGISWFGAYAYAKWAGGSLPSEAQWEHACRGGANPLWPWYFGPKSYDNNDTETTDDDINYMAPYAFYSRNLPPQVGPIIGYAYPVGLCQPNGYGLYDMHGNASEYCMDAYDVPSLFVTLGNDYVNASSSTTAQRVTKGGSIYDTAEDCAITSVEPGEPHHTQYVPISFRVVWNAL